MTTPENGQLRVNILWGLRWGLIFCLIFSLIVVAAYLLGNREPSSSPGALTLGDALLYLAASCAFGGLILGVFRRQASSAFGASVLGFVIVGFAAIMLSLLSEDKPGSTWETILLAMLTGLILGVPVGRTYFKIFRGVSRSSSEE
jgi:RsiW-degrading membrane proteinase PrsW (M82 family)